MWEHRIATNEVKEIRSRVLDYFGIGAIKKIDEIMKNLSEQGVKKVICVTGQGSYKRSGAWDYVSEAFKKYGVSYAIYDKVTPNPTADSVDEATKMARDFGAQTVVAIGGGSPIDAGKSVAILMEYKDQDARSLYRFKFNPTKAAPIVAINLTHGTGTEVDRFAVVSIPELNYKPAIAYDCIYPMYAIDDPALMTGLSADQTRYVSIDAINHVVEAATTKAASPYSIMMAKETVRLVATYLPQALSHPEDLTARYYLLYASIIAGISFDNGLLHFTHALEHPLSGVKPELSHGLGLAILLPAVVKQIYPACAEVLAEIFAPIVDGLKGIPAEAERAARGVEKWLYAMGVTSKLADEGFKESDIDRLTDLTMTTPSLDGLLAMAPIRANREVIRTIYVESMRPLCCS
ncbi:MAG: iron-containing alcohol dehydrogenase [Acetomicrobium sp.]|nr:iron-containing alcohol dehydrogenase [Acetomicrobium sp.]